MYEELKEAMRTLLDKLKKRRDISFFDTDEAYEKWMSENLALTGYNTVEEAIRFRRYCIDLDKRMMTENAELFELIRRATKEQRTEILKPHRLTPADFGR